MNGRWGWHHKCRCLRATIKSGAKMSKRTTFPRTQLNIGTACPSAFLWFVCSLCLSKVSKHFSAQKTARKLHFMVELAGFLCACWSRAMKGRRRKNGPTKFLCHCCALLKFCNIEHNANWLKCIHRFMQEIASVCNVNMTLAFIALEHTPRHIRCNHLLAFYFTVADGLCGFLHRRYYGWISYTFRSILFRCFVVGGGCFVIEARLCHILLCLLILFGEWEHVFGQCSIFVWYLCLADLFLIIFRAQCDDYNSGRFSLSLPKWRAYNLEAIYLFRYSSRSGL